MPKVTSLKRINPATRARFIDAKTNIFTNKHKAFYSNLDNDRFIIIFKSNNFRRVK